MPLDIQSFFQNNLILFLMALWVLPWKGWALWKAARLSDKWWFVAILILNTLAILDIIYIYWISKRKSLSGNIVAAPEPIVPISLPVEKPKNLHRGRRAAQVK